MTFTRLSDHLCVGYGKYRDLIILYYVSTWNEWRIAINDRELMHVTFTTLTEMTDYAIKEYGPPDENFI